MPSIDEIKERLSKITPSPWMVERRSGNAKIGVYKKTPTGLTLGAVCHTKFHSKQDDTQCLLDADFIANAPEDIEYLLNVIEGLAKAHVA
jgi:hypothetical protein